MSIVGKQVNIWNSITHSLNNFMSPKINTLLFKCFYPLFHLILTITLRKKTMMGGILIPILQNRKWPQRCCDREHNSQTSVRFPLWQADYA